MWFDVCGLMFAVQLLAATRSSEQAQFKSQDGLSGDGEGNSQVALRLCVCGAAVQ
jgi:hypothetical protein